MNKKALAVSIVIPVFNDENYIKNCLDAVKKQIVKPDEVIIVDNNCTDNSIKKAKEYDFVKVVKETKQGVLFARSKGFNVAQGDVIGRVDADTRMNKDWVKQLHAIFKDDSVAAVTGPLYFFDMPFSPHNIFLDHMFKGPLHKYDKKFPFLAGNNMAIRKTAWNFVKTDECKDKTIHEDIDLAIHLHINNYKVIYDNRLRAGTSARRYDDRPKQLRRYTSMTRRAFKNHKMRPFGIFVSEIAYTLGYILLWPIKRSYNPKTGRRTIRQFIRGSTPRKNPAD